MTPYYYFHIPSKSILNEYGCLIALVIFFSPLLLGCLSLVLVIGFILFAIFDSLCELDRQSEYPLEAFTEMVVVKIEDKKVLQVHSYDPDSTEEKYILRVPHPLTYFPIDFDLLERSSGRHYLETLYLFDTIEVGDMVEARYHPTDDEVLCLALLFDNEKYENWLIEKKIKKPRKWF